MRITRRIMVAGALASAAALAGPSFAQGQSVKVGIIGPFSGPFAHYGTLFKAGAEAYVANQGGKLGGKNVEFIYRDTGDVGSRADRQGQSGLPRGFCLYPQCARGSPIDSAISDARRDLQRGYIVYHRKVRVLHPNKLHAVAGDGPDGAMGREAGHDQGCDGSH